MQYKVFLGAALLAVFSSVSYSQGPVGDKVMVTFDRPVQVGSHVLPAGEYTIRQVTSASNPRILEFTTDHGTKLEATVAAIPVLQNTAPSQTKVVMDNEQGMARLDTIWVQGKNYGYQFPSGPVAGTVSTAGVNLQGQFTQPAAPAPTVAQTPPPPQEPAPAAQTPPPAPRVEERVEERTEIAQTQPPPAPENQVTQNQNQVAQNQTPPPASTAPAPSNQPATSAESNAGKVPATALGWVQIALIGFALAAAGSLLYWRERAAR